MTTYRSSRQRVAPCPFMTEEEKFASELAGDDHHEFVGGAVFAVWPNSTKAVADPPHAFGHQPLAFVGE